MSDSYHVTSAHFKGLSKRELNEMVEDPQSLLHQWSDKSAKKEAVRKEQKIKKKKI